MSRPLQAIVFDFDGVIANSEPLHLLAFQHTLAEAGAQLSAEDYYSRYLGFDDVGMFEAFGRDRRLPMTEDRVAELVTRKGDHMCPTSLRWNFVVTCSASVDGFPNWSSQTRPLNPPLSTTSVSPSHLAVEYPCHVGATSGCGTKVRPSVNACHQRLNAS